MVVCVAGMHRSGTSLVARLLNLGGLYLGREQDMLPANPTNPDGHWEHERIVEINDELLAEFGGGWDYPPDLSGLGDLHRVARLEQKARGAGAIRWARPLGLEGSPQQPDAAVLAAPRGGPCASWFA